jgi:hypothetical protein
MADLFNQQISATYSGLLKTSSSGVLSASLTQITDGRGNGSPLYISTTVGAVDGAINFYNAYTFPSADGLDGQVLKTDGAGVLTWENDSLSNTLNFSGGTGTGSVTLDSQTLAFTGTANQIETSASSQAITLSFPTAGVTLPDGSVATTQTASDNSTKVATTAYVEAAVAAGGDVTKTGTITANQIAVWNDSTDKLRSDETVTIGTDHSITLLQKNSLDDDRGTHNIGGGNIDDVTGQNNVGFGIDNLGYLVSGQDNNAFGNNSQISNSSGSYNTSFGNQTLNYHSSSDYNVAIGYQSLRGDNIGGTPSSDNNTAIGTFSLRLVDGGNSNTAIGYNSGSAITTGSYNVIIGSNTGSTIATSSSNIIISDGIGNIRQSFDFTGTATFSGNVDIINTTTDAAGELRIGGILASDDLPFGIINFANTAAANSQANDILAYIAGEKTGSSNTADLTFATSSNAAPVERLRISSGGDVGVGTTPNAAGATWRTLFIGSSGTIISRQASTGVDTFFANNYYVNSSNVDTRRVVGGSSRMMLLGDVIKFQNSPTGAANASPSWSNRLTIESGGAATFSGSVTVKNILTSNANTATNLITRNSTNTALYVQQAGTGNIFEARQGSMLAGQGNLRMSISSGGDATFSGTTSANVVISRDNMFVGLGQLYIGAENSNTDDTYRQSVGSGIFKIQSRESGTWTDRLTISSGGNATFNETTTLNATGNSYTDGSLVLRNSDGTTNTYLTNAAGAFYLSNNGTSAALTISSGGAATFSGSVTCVQLNASVAISMEAAGTNSVAAGGYYRYLNTSNSYQILKQINTNTDEDTWAFRGSWNKIGTLNASTGVYTALSDINKKKDFEESTIGLSAIIGLKPTLYRMKDDESEGKKELGFIAQEVKDYIPQAYVENGDDDYQFVGLNYNAIVATLTKAIQEQQTIIEDLKSRIETLEG